jgi:hypothetical protein
VANEEVPGLADAVRPYADLLYPLIDGTLPPGEFEMLYFERYKDDPAMLSDEVFDIVDGFFADVDAYVDDPSIRDLANGDLGPDELRASAERLLRRAGLRD